MSPYIKRQILTYTLLCLVNLGWDNVLIYSKLIFSSKFRLILAGQCVSKMLQSVYIKLYNCMLLKKVE